LLIVIAESNLGCSRLTDIRLTDRIILATSWQIEQNNIQLEYCRDLMAPPIATK